MDFVIEFLLQVIFEFVLELLGHLGAVALRRVLGSRGGRLAAALGLGFTGGFLWGKHATTTGIGHEPRSLWVSIGLAVIASTVAGVVHSRKGDDKAATKNWDMFLPWRWDELRLVGFAVLNLAIAGGIIVGFHPLR